VDLDNQGRVIIRTVYDIKEAISEFLKEDDATEMQTVIMSGGKKYAVKAESSCSYSRMFIEGFDILKRRKEAAENIKVKDGCSPIMLEGRMWLDDLIERRLGGVRDDLRVRWDLDDGTYYYDPFAKKLTKAIDDGTSSID